MSPSGCTSVLRYLSVVNVLPKSRIGNVLRWVVTNARTVDGSVRCIFGSPNVVMLSIELQNYLLSFSGEILRDFAP